MTSGPRDFDADRQVAAAASTVPGLAAVPHSPEQPEPDLATPPSSADSGSGAPTGEELRGAIEAVLLIVDEPVPATVLAAAVGAPVPMVAGTLHELREEYTADRRGFDLREVGGGWRLYTRSEFAPVIEHFMLEGQHARLTQAALETLAVVAYRQPVSRSRVSAVRGVNVDGVMRTLVTRGLVEEAGADEGTGAMLYRTTPYFLERLGIRTLDELPSLADFLPENTSIDELERQLSSGGQDE